MISSFYILKSISNKLKNFVSPNTRLFFKRILFTPLSLLLSLLFISLLPSSYILATNALTNPSFTGGTTGWTLSKSGNNTTIAYNSTTYQDSAGSVLASTAGRNKSGTSTTVQTTSQNIQGGSIVSLSFYYYKHCGTYPAFPASGEDGCTTNTLEARVQRTGGTESTVWSHTSTVSTGSWVQLSNLDISSYFATTGTYILKFYTSQTTVGSTDAANYIYVDNVNLNVTVPATTVGTTGTQTSTIMQNTSNAYIGGAFTFQTDTGTTSVTSITANETGTIADANISGLILYYKEEVSCSSSIPSGTTQFNSTPGTFSSGSSTVTGTMSVGTSQICVYVEADIGSGASAGNTIEIQITNPSTQVTVSTGAVSPSTAVAIAGTTTITAPNTPPTFSTFSNNGPKSPGNTITFSTVASDADSENIKLTVCRTAGVTGTACDGGAEDTFCSSSLVASNPSCTYSIPAVTPDTIYNVFPYIFDAQDLASTSAKQGALSLFAVSNVAPVVSAVTLNGGANINLVENSTKAVTITATVTDNNSCAGTEISSVLAYVYRSGFGQSSCMNSSLYLYSNTCGGSGSSEGQFDSPTDVAVDSSGNIYVTDGANHRVQKFNSSLQYVSSFGTEGSGNGQFATPEGIFIDSYGNIFVVESTNNRVQRFNSSGQYLDTFADERSPLSDPTDVAVDSNGYVWVADTYNYRIVKYDTMGSIIKSIGTYGTGDGQFALPYGIDIDSNNNVYVVDKDNNRVEKFDSEGVYITQFGIEGTGAGEFNYPTKIDIDPSGNIWVVDSGNKRFQKFDSTGGYIRDFGTAGTGDGQFSNPVGIGVSTNDLVYVADYSRDDVQEFSTTNNNYCYSQISCTQVEGSCTGTTDASANYTCTADFKYFTDPTDTATLYEAQNWLSTVKAVDNNYISAQAVVSAGVEVNSLVAFNVTSSINYGTLGIEQSNNPLNKTTTITPTGNVGLNEELSGPAYMCTDYPTCSGAKIGVDNQRYSLTSSTAYSAGTSLTTTATEVQLRIPKPKALSPASKSIWWGMYVPAETSPGTYNGAITITGVKSDPAYWN